jgi:NAD(P)-dependent dehydrogenase (short-subunit alcohol dehydrogenase family)
MSDLSGKSILITGASAGIGRALCVALAPLQCRLALAARDASGLETVAGECRKLGSEALVVPTDVTDPEACRRLVEATEQRFGGIDAVVNNAGISMDARFDEVTDLGVFDRLMRVNYLGSVYVTWHALPALKRSRGRLAFVSSLAGLTGVPRRSGYSPTKHALFGFADTLRLELVDSGVTVTVIAPDFVQSEIHVRSLDATGKPIGASPLQEDKLMTADECAREIIRALERRERQRLLSLRGWLGYRLRPWFPGLIDRIAMRAVRRGK